MKTILLVAAVAGGILFLYMALMIGAYVASS